MTKMNKSGIVIILLCFLAAVAVVLWERRKVRKRWKKSKGCWTLHDLAFLKSLDESQLSALKQSLHTIFLCRRSIFSKYGTGKRQNQILIADISPVTKRRLQPAVIQPSLMEETLPASAKENVEALYKQSEKLRFLIDFSRKTFQTGKWDHFTFPQQASLQPLLGKRSRTICHKASEKDLSISVSTEIFRHI